MSFAYPIMLDLAGRRAVIVGGGTVAAHKAQALFDGGCTDVIMVAPNFPSALPPAAQKIGEYYDSRHLDGAFIVFAATDSSAVNEQVVRDAEARNLLVGRADFDETASGNFTSPAVYRHGPVVIAVSAGGSPSLAGEIRKRLLKNLPTRYAIMADAMQSLRPEIRARVLNADQRRAIFRDLASPTALAVLDRYGIEVLREWLIKRYPMLK
jgi:precorrin-2 dehydrogenase/sirohydrochlorin ferrochelatase